ncbi:MAG: hypothetical protein AAGJ32_05055 [Pseudomonadota bacterium]
MSEVDAGPNTLTLYQARPAGSDGAYLPLVLYVDHIAAARDSGAETTVVSLSNGESFEVKLPLERFTMRQRLDSTES